VTKKRHRLKTKGYEKSIAPEKKPVIKRYDLTKINKENCNLLISNPRPPDSDLVLYQFCYTSTTVLEHV